MPVSFSKLRITGFKSFAEPTGVEILPGLTGIIGPNGCGKSNIVEALRWAMGESSARGLRGGEMEDVIFAGTAGRPSRNIAEVVVTLSDTHGVAPPPFHEQAELEIQRRIERGAGSNYRINGKEARARDVQTLFADLASGARASAMVSQGRVGALVAARPEERRAVLEEAAGITGLHARRHEAELKLRAAEANLTRAEDLRGQLESQLGSLKRQARQASRYRNISGAIRAAEADLLAIQRARAEHDRTAAETALQAAEAAVAEAANMVALTRAEAAQTAGSLPPLRDAEASSRTTLERHRVAREHLAAEESRARAALHEARGRLAQLRTDLEHAEQIRADAMAAEARLASEDAALAEADLAYPDKLRVVEGEAVEAADQARLAEREANRATEAAAEANAQAQGAMQAMAQAEQRVRRLLDQLARLRGERGTIAGQQIDPAALDRSALGQAEAQAALTEARTAVETAEQEHVAAATALAAARQDRSRADGARAKLLAEIQALAEVLSIRDGERWPPMIDSVTAPSGLEAALGAALGEELTSALDPDADRYWRELPPLGAGPRLPGGATALIELVEAPSALARSLSQIALVESEQVALDCHADLAPGQVLVSREGAIWRWDGYTVRAGTPTPAAVRLSQRNRLAVLRDASAEATRDAERANADQDAAERLAQAAALNEQVARTRRREAERRFEQAHTGHTLLRGQAATASARLAAADEQLERLDREHQEAAATLDVARASCAARPDLDGLRASVERSRGVLAQARSRESAALSTRETLVRDHANRLNRRRAIDAERNRWIERARDAEVRVGDLTNRLNTAQQELAAAEAAPAQAAARQREAFEALQVAEGSHRRAAATLSEAIAIASEADRAAREAEALLSGHREASVRAEGIARQANHVWGTVAERILERLGASPVLPDPPAELTPEIEAKARGRLERLAKERDEMGPVNLRAETEAEAVEQQIAAIDKDREELTTAIARLRGSIGNLNREGRERLTQVFQAVDRHFQQLFARMFGGGRAHLALVGSDDPLQAGLEIYAQPPGKKLASLSLLSGGEQALTALSLIFAVFRCNPAPICVLDEVDAPLDDANVERFCMLLEDIERETKTRFLVVTHHPMTMARMDRLYGVTMQERGVSRLLSVDLERAAAMVEQRQLPLDDRARLSQRIDEPTGSVHPGRMLRRFEALLDPTAPEPTPPPTLGLARFYWHYIRQARWLAVSLYVVGGLIAVLDTTIPTFIGRVVSLVSTHTPETLVPDCWRELLWMAIVLGLVRPLGHFAHTVIVNQVINPSFTNLIRWQNHWHVVRQSWTFFQNDFAGRVANRVMQTGPALRESLVMAFDAAWYIVVYGGSALILLGSLNWRLMMPMTTWFACYLSMLIYLVPRLRERSRAVSEKRSTLIGRVVDSYTNILTVKLFARALDEDAFVRDSIDEHTAAFRDQSRMSSAYTIVLGIMNASLVVGTATIAIWQWSAGHISVGGVATAIPMSWQLTTIAGWVARNITAIFENVGTVQDGMRSIDVPRQMPDPPGARELVVKGGEIQFENVHFDYGRQPRPGGVLRGIDLVIAPGERVGLVGPSGAGKSTLVNLLLHFYDPGRGRIRIDGQDIADVTQESLRTQIAMVTQDTSLLHRSIRDNISYGRPEATDAMIEAAARQAEAHEFIVGLEDWHQRHGYDAHVGERGVKLSGGQRQRVALARVILKNAPILVLDEATSALDSEVEAAIQSQLDGLMEGRTVIAIAHRLSTIARMDRLVVLDGGRIVETGSHAELLARNGVYARLWHRQSGGFAPALANIAAK